MSAHYANITLSGPTPPEIADYLGRQRIAAYVSPAIRGAVVIFHEDLPGQEDLARRLSNHFSCPSLLVMGYGQQILLYQLYEAGELADAYVSNPHEELEIGEAPAGNAEILCAAFAAERNLRRVEMILRKESSDTHAYAYAVNRHGELFRALGLPLAAAGASFEAIEIGELPATDFDPTHLMRTTGP